jgi:tripartite-type tricarboxylate transporter receptor subunit TctC
MKFENTFPIAATIVALSIGLAAPQAAAQNYPDKPIRILVGAAAGGPSDLPARFAVQILQAKFGQPVIIENRPGAAGTVAGRFVVSALPDGYTLLVGNTTILAVQPSVSASAGFEPRNFAAVAMVSESYLIPVVSPSSPFKTLKELVDYAKANPGKLNFGTIATGSTQHLSAELFKLATGVQAPIVIYKTTPELVTAILRGDVDVGFDYYAAFGPSIVNKQFKVIATSGEQRAPQLPAVPTVKESGYPDFVVTSWNAIQGPAGVPKDIVTKLNEHIVAALKTPEIQARMGDLGIHPMIGSPEFLDERMKSEIAKWAKVIQAAGVEKQ